MQGQGNVGLNQTQGFAQSIPRDTAAQWVQYRHHLMHRSSGLIQIQFAPEVSDVHLTPNPFVMGDAVLIEQAATIDQDGLGIEFGQDRGDGFELLPAGDENHRLHTF
jgi:hypothetical protein